MRDSFGRKLAFFALTMALLVNAANLWVHAQNNLPTAGPTQVQAIQALPYTTAISATAAVNTQTTLTIPAPPATYYNYICSLGYDLTNDNTGTAVSNAVSTSTNFNSFAVKVSQVATASQMNSPWFQRYGDPATGGCVKSAAPGTATTFVSASGLTHAAWTWYATYYQGT